MSTITITDADFESEVLKSDTPVLVDFWAEWCPPCKALIPVLEELAGEMKDTVKIAKINIEENPNIPTTYGVRSLPTLILFKDGEALSQTVGAVPKADLEQWINEAVS